MGAATALLALLALALQCGGVLGAAPIARHMSVTVPKGTEVVITLAGYDSDGDKLTAHVTAVPNSGVVHQLSQVFSDFGYEPKRGTQVSSASAGSPVVVTGSKNRIVYTPPANTNPPEHMWSQFTYTVSDGTTTSEPGIIWLLPPSTKIVSSDFSAGLDSWVVEGNGARASAMLAGGLVYEPYSRGLLNHYVLATDAEIHTNKVSGDDDSRWYFVAPNKFLGNHAVAYGGQLTFSLASAAGDFGSANINGQAALVVLECASCNSGSLIRLARFADASSIVLDGKSKTITIPLTETEWKEDPKNTLQAWGNPTKCEMVEVLSGLTSVKILGDHTKWYESVALDNVAYISGKPGSVPVQCADIYY